MQMYANVKVYVMDLCISYNKYPIRDVIAFIWYKLVYVVYAVSTLYVA